MHSNSINPAYLNIRRWIAFDVETSGELPEYGLQPWSNKSYITSFATARVKSRLLANSFNIHTPEKNKQVLISRDHEDINNFLQLALNGDKVVVGWNVAFDAAWLIKLGYKEEVLQLRWLDGMLLWKHLTRVPESHIAQSKRKKYGLKDAVAEFLPQYAGYADGVDFHSHAPEDIHRRLKYNRYDAVLTFVIINKLMSVMMRRGHHKQLRSAIIECKCIPLIADHYITGLCVDKSAAKDLDARLGQEQDELKKRLEAWGVSEKVLASPLQLRKRLYEDWNLPVLKETPKGDPSTDKEALHELSFIDERARSIRRHREIKGLRTKFIDNLLTSCDYNSDGRTHPTANIYSTYTGRMTFSSTVGKRGTKTKRQTGFALHQMKRDNNFRRAICAPDGWGIVEWDFAGQEYRWVAIESSDSTMLSLCEPGEDAHSFMAAEMTDYTYQEMRAAYKSGAEDAYEKRMAGKVGNLSCQYRIGPKSLLSTARVDYDLPWDMAMAKFVHRTYHHTYPGVRLYWDRKIREAKLNGYAETIAGRRVLLNGNWGGSDAWRLESTAINFPIQGVGADQKYLAMWCVQPILTKYGGKFYFELHDGLYAIFPNKVLERAAVAGKKLLSNLPYKKAWGFHPPIPLPCDAKYGPNWGDLVEV